MQSLFPDHDTTSAPKDAVAALTDAERRFTTAVVAARGWVDEAEIDAFQEAGYDSQQVLEVVLGVGMKTLSNYTNHMAGTELDAAFQHRVWRANEAG